MWQCIAEASRVTLVRLSLQAQILAGMDAEVVVGALLWAQRFVDASNGAFVGLLEGLKEWYAEHRQEVSKAHVQQLWADAPDLAFDMYHGKRTRRE